ncbi:MAG: hypothetical protein AAF205_12020 [Pseudomonadota bacterium]
MFGGAIHGESVAEDFLFLKGGLRGGWRGMPIRYWVESRSSGFWDALRTNIYPLKKILRNLRAIDLSEISMVSVVKSTCFLFLSAVAMLGCATNEPAMLERPAPIELSISLQPDEKLLIQYTLRETANALYYEHELDGYRSETWKPNDPAFRWVSDGKGERLERRDGRPFHDVELTIPIDYRALPKSYAPFSPFSRGGTLIHSGQFHVCLAAPCEAPLSLPMTISAKRATVGIGGQRLAERANFISENSGTNIFVGTLEPVESDGFIAIIDPGLPEDVRSHLISSLPRAVAYFSKIYGPLSFTPELYVSIDGRPEPRGGISTQGGTLPRQIFMHFDGEDAEKRASEGSPLWLDWFFAHEAAHLFQQDGAGIRAFDTTAAWIHEGGADAMAALSLFSQEDEKRSYAVERGQQAFRACEMGMSETALSMATAEGKFDLHYQCGLLVWLALDQQLHETGAGNLDDLNKLFFARVRNGQQWDEDVFFDTAQNFGVDPALVLDIQELSADSSSDRLASLRRIGSIAERALERHSLASI